MNKINMLAHVWQGGSVLGGLYVYSNAFFYSPTKT